MMTVMQPPEAARNPYVVPKPALGNGERLLEDSPCDGDEKEQLFPRFEEKEISLGRFLGKGAFCDVFEVKNITIYPHSPFARDDAAREERKAVADKCGDAKKHSPYVIKKVSDKCIADRLAMGINHLATEAKILSLLDHPHIIKMKAISNVEPLNEGHFVLLDRMNETLEQRIDYWKAKERRRKSHLDIGKLSLRRGGVKGRREHHSVDERIKVAIYVASALKYIHDESIIYRDLKPDNVGFDSRGDLKIFDMGLAKELTDELRYSDGTYNLTGFTGSLRYMAPEVAMELPYALSADVYSFGILLWQIMSLNTPFSSHSSKMHHHLVFEKGCRPTCDKSWPDDVKKVIKKCWSQFPMDRMIFEDILQCLDRSREDRLQRRSTGSRTLLKMRHSFRSVSSLSASALGVEDY